MKKAVNVLLSDEVYEGMENFPRSVSMSSILRCLVIAATTPEEKEWKRILEGDADLKKARDAIRGYLRSTGRRTIAL